MVGVVCGPGSDSAAMSRPMSVGRVVKCVSLGSLVGVVCVVSSLAVLGLFYESEHSVRGGELLVALIVGVPSGALFGLFVASRSR